MDKLNIEKKYGKIAIEWDFPEYEQFNSINAGLIFTGFIAICLLIYSLFTANFLFSIIIVLVVLIVALRQFTPPRQVTLMITEMGIILDNIFYAFHEIDNFWIIYNPPKVKSLYFQLSKTMSITKRIPLLDINPILIRELLAKHLKEDLTREEEDLTETLGRVLKL